MMDLSPMHLLDPDVSDTIHHMYSVSHNVSNGQEKTCSFGWRNVGMQDKPGTVFPLLLSSNEIVKENNSGTKVSSIIDLLQYILEAK